MDRIEFNNSLNADQPLEYFDELMSCYDLVSYYDMLHVDNYTPIDNNSILFTISITSDTPVEKVKGILDSTIIDKYNKVFRINSTIIDYNKLNVIFCKIGVSG